MTCMREPALALSSCERQNVRCWGLTLVVQRGQNGGMTNPTASWKHYVAIGDSFTEGLWDFVDGGTFTDHEVDADRPLHGWADRVAQRLSQERVDAGEPPLEYANLAIRGRLLSDIVTAQLDQALEMRPDLISLVGGGNDLLRVDSDPDVLARRLEAAVVRARDAGADVLLSTGMDVANSPLVRRARPRVAVFNSHIWSMARRHGAYVLDLWGLRPLMDWEMWSADRIHLTPEGHRRVSQAALVALGFVPDDEQWDKPLRPNAEPATVAENLRWTRSHAVPWVMRRVQGRSSGDGRAPKRPELEPVSKN